MRAYGHFLCSRKLRLKKPVSDWRQKRQSYAVEKAPFQSKNYDYDVQLDQTVEKTEISYPTRQSDSCIGNVRKSIRILVRLSHTHTTTRRPYDPTPHHNTGDAGLAAVTSAAARLESARNILIYVRQQYVTAPDGRSVRYRL